MSRAAIALGSNLGDRLGHLRAAIGRLREIAMPGEVFLTAPVYQTEPRLCPPDSPDFLNTVVEIDFAGSPLDLLKHTRAIEQQLGRTPAAERNAPRVIDLDILYLGDETSTGDLLELPHPRIQERRFVLQPLADIRPDLILPGHDQTIAALLAHLPSDEAPLVVLADAGIHVC
jgi:2-amino-4-hydroxy-6-hydroxymethyldihydropteridine diphosphokinase